MKYKKPILFKILIGIGVLIFIFVIFLAISSRIQQSDNGTINVVAIPNDSKIFIDGVDRQKMGTFLLSPGPHTISATRSGFKNIEKKIISEAGKETDVTLLLEVDSEEGFEWEQANIEQVRKKERIGGLLVAQDGIDFAEKNPIVNKTPFKTPNFRIDYSLNSTGGVDLIVSAYGIEGRGLAFAQIRQWGFDPEKFVVIFKDLSL